MTVKELMALLQDVPQDLDVIVFLPDTGNVTGIAVLGPTGHQAVEIKHDINISPEEMRGESPDNPA